MLVVTAYGLSTRRGRSKMALSRLLSLQVFCHTTFIKLVIYQQMRENVGEYSELHELGKLLTCTSSVRSRRALFPDRLTSTPRVKSDIDERANS